MCLNKLLNYKLLIVIENILYDFENCQSMVKFLTVEIFLMHYYFGLCQHEERGDCCALTEQVVTH